MNDIIITYKNMQDESIVRLKIRNGFEYEVIPVPRQISITCGIAHKISSEYFVDIYKIIFELFNSGAISKSNIHFYKDLGNDNYENLNFDEYNLDSENI